MFSKTRRKIVVSIIVVGILFLAVMLSSIYITNAAAYRKQNAEMLDRYVAMYSLDNLPGESLPPEMPAGEVMPPADGNLFLLSSFYSVSFLENGEVLNVDTGRQGIYHEQDIVSLAYEILQENKTSGVLSHFMYRVDRREGYTLVAFMDVAVSTASMNSLLKIVLTAGIVSICIISLAAVFVAHLIIKPLEENDRKQKQFIADAEHELKTPVSVISANAELLERQTGKNKWLENIQYENERMSNLIQDLLNLSRAENTEFIPERMNFSELAEQEILPFESIAYEHGLSIETSIHDSIYVEGNRVQLCQLVSILTDNAISHGDGGSIQIGLYRNHRNAVFTVKNKGKEIPGAVRERLFDRFFRMDEAREDQGSHYGLGLPIAKAITEAHKGKISIDCADGEVIVTATIPAEK